MTRKEGYAHFHETTSEWFRDKFVNYIVGPERDREAHHHTITDQRTGQSGEGYGWTYSEARKEAWEDLLNKIGDESIWLKR